MEKSQHLDIESIQLDEQSSCTPSPSPSPRDKRKKKKKSKPARLFSFDESKQHKLDDEKTNKSPTPFTGSSPVPIPVRITRSFEYEDAQEFVSSPTSPYPLSRSCPSRSALRGGHEGLGLGPRPKLHVKWALDVRDPPMSSMSHTLKLNHRGDQRKNMKKKNNKRKTKTNHKASKDAGLKQPANGPAVGNQEDSCASDSEEVHPDDEKDEIVSSEFMNQLQACGSSKTPDFSSVAENQGSAGWLSFLDVAMQHMLLASNFIKKENVAGALIEYKAAAHVFRLAKADAENDNEKSECKSAVEQAARGQILAWIAMATLYSASGQLSKGQKCHKLAIEACESVGVSLSDSLRSMNGLESLLVPSSSFKGNSHCSFAASLASPNDNSRTEVI